MSEHKPWTASRYRQTVKAAARAVLAARRERGIKDPDDLRDALEAEIRNVFAPIGIHDVSTRYALLSFSDHAMAGWIPATSTTQSHEWINALGRAALRADVWALVVERLPKRMRERAEQGIGGANDRQPEVERVRLDRGGYTKDGRYFGAGGPLFRVTSDAYPFDVEEYVRASDAKAARETVRQQLAERMRHKAAVARRTGEDPAEYEDSGAELGARPGKPALRPGYALVYQVDPEQGEEQVLSATDVRGAQYERTANLWGDAYRVFRLRDGRHAAATLAMTNPMSVHERDQLEGLA